MSYWFSSKEKKAGLRFPQAIPEGRAEDIRSSPLTTISPVQMASRTPLIERYREIIENLLFEFENFLSLFVVFSPVFNLLVFEIMDIFNIE